MKRRHSREFKLSSTKIALIIFTVIIAFAGLGFWLFGTSTAATSGKMVLYLHAERSDVNQSYNAMTFTPPESSTNNSTGVTSTTTTNATPATSFCTSSGLAAVGSSFNVTGASAAATGNYCMTTFISIPVGQAISMSTADAASITGQFWSSESKNTVSAALNIYIYRWNGTGTTVNSTDRIATLTCSDPSTSATSCVPTAVAPANNITFAATDRIVAIVSINVTGASSSQSVSMYWDSTSRAASQITLKYTAVTPNKPTLTGPLDDDFTTAAATTACSTSGVTYNTKWTCLQGSAASTAGAFNAEDTGATGTGDSSSWIWLRNQTTATSAVPSDFGATPSNTFLYQALPSAYGSGNVRTVLSASNLYAEAGATLPSSPYNHAGLVLWSSNTDYLEIYVSAQNDTTPTSTGNMWLSLTNSGTVASTVDLNAVASAGTYNRIWLGFSNSNGSWQAQYSTDGLTWNNFGSPISHGIFSRTGLDAFSDIASPATSYAGAFEWFQSTLAAPTYNQISYRWFANADSTTPGSPFTLQNTPYVLTSTGEQFRLRALVSAQGQIGLNAQSLNLQVAAMNSYANCGAIPSANYLSLQPGASWTEATANAPWVGRLGFAAVVFNNKIWIYGGANYGVSTFYNDVWYSSDGVNWTEATTSAAWTGRYNMGYAVYNNKMWIFGGYDSTFSLKNDVWSSSDGVTWTQATAAAAWTARQGFGSTVFNNEMWVIGGFDSSSSTKHDVYYSTDGITWTQATSAAAWSAREQFGTTVYNSKMWIFGGSTTGSDALNDVWSSTDGITWTQATSAAGWSIRTYMATAVYNNQMWVIGGGKSGPSYYNDVWYSSDGATWTEATASAAWSQRDLAAAVVLNNDLWLMGGSGSSSADNDVWYTTTAPISYYNNPTPASGAAITSTANDPTDGTQTINPQTYQEADGFTNSQSTYGGTVDAEWDFSLYDNGAPSGTTYCFRIVKADGTLLDTYTNYPMITTTPTIDQFMRGGMWFTKGGSKQGYYWAQ